MSQRMRIEVLHVPCGNTSPLYSEMQVEQNSLSFSRTSDRRRGTSDLRHEEELMRDVIVQQNQSLLTRVEEIAEEQRVADAGPAVQAVQKTVEIHRFSTNSADSQVQFLDKVVVIPMVVQHQVSMVQVVQKNSWSR